MADQQQEQPQIITLDDSNSVQILLQYVEVAQKAGTFILSEAEILKRCKDVLISNLNDSEINTVQAKQLIIQAIIKGQAKGAFTLDDASILHKVCQFVSTTLTPQVQPQPVQPQQVQPSQQQPQVQPSQQQPQVQPQVSEEDDLSSLSDPVPLKTSRPRVV